MSERKYNKINQECFFSTEFTLFVFMFQVHLKSQFIMNGVCVVWRGWVDLHRLDGVGSLQFDEDRAEVRLDIIKYR